MKDLMMRRRTPIHSQITDTIRARIAAGRYKKSGLPRELNLMEEFNVSRHTIRSALQKLVIEGLIERRSGAGTFVSERGFGGSWEIGSLDEILGNASLANTTVLEAKLVLAKDFPQQAAIFSVPRTGKLFRLVKLLSADGSSYAVAHLFTSAAYASRIPRNLMGKVRLVELIERFNGVSSAHVKQVASALAARVQLAQQLRMNPSDPILVLQRTYTNIDHKPIMHIEMFCHPSYYQQIVNFSRKSFY